MSDGGDDADTTGDDGDHGETAADGADDGDDQTDTAGEQTAAGIDDAVATFLEAADDVYEEYDRGYVDPDAALARLRRDVGRLRDARED
jgi:hypothetical protein